MSTVYQITIPDSVEWQTETQNLPYRRVKAKLLIYTLYLDLVRDDDDDDKMMWIPTIHDNIVDADVYTCFDDYSWDADDLEDAKEEILAEALDLLRDYLVDDFGATVVTAMTASEDIDSLELEN